MKENDFLKELDKFIMKKMGDRILDLRINEKLWTQERLAEEAGLTCNHIGLIERGKRNFRITTLRKIARAYEMPVSELCRFNLFSEEEFYCPKDERF